MGDTSANAPGEPIRPLQRRVARREEQLPPELAPGERREVGRSSNALREIPILIAVALGLALILKTFLVQAFWIPSGSMENTLLEHDRVLVNKFTGHFGSPERGQVVVFGDPGHWLPAKPQHAPSNALMRGLHDVFVFIGLMPANSDDDLIKRVIGLPGDHVVCCSKAGKVTVNGVELDETAYLYRNPQTGVQDAPSLIPFSVTVPPGHLWVMGDHRSDSSDSRLHMQDPGNGFVPETNVVGRAFVRVWPLGRWGLLPIPDTFHNKAIDSPAAAGP